MNDILKSRVNDLKQIFENEIKKDLMDKDVVNVIKILSTTMSTEERKQRIIEKKYFEKDKIDTFTYFENIIIFFESLTDLDIFNEHKKCKENIKKEELKKLLEIDFLRDFSKDNNLKFKIKRELFKIKSDIYNNLDRYALSYQLIKNYEEDVKSTIDCLSKLKDDIKKIIDSSREFYVEFGRHEYESKILDSYEFLTQDIYYDINKFISYDKKFRLNLVLSVRHFESYFEKIEKEIKKLENTILLMQHIIKIVDLYMKKGIEDPSRLRESFRAFDKNRIEILFTIEII